MQKCLLLGVKLILYEEKEVGVYWIFDEINPSPPLDLLGKIQFEYLNIPGGILVITMQTVREDKPFPNLYLNTR